MWLDLIKGVFAGLAQCVLALFGMSADQKLGRAEVSNTNLKAQLAELKAEDAAAREIPHGKAETIEALKNGEL